MDFLSWTIGKVEIYQVVELEAGKIIQETVRGATPEWTAASDTYPEMATASRKKILSEIADTDTLLIGSHFPDPIAGKVDKTRKGYVFKI